MFKIYGNSLGDHVVDLLLLTVPYMLDSTFFLNIIKVNILNI